MKQQPKVSVCMITYGHEKFIAQAINGVLMQECDFEVELVIANDCSPDKTDEVIQDILKNHPRASWINYIKHEKNMGMMPNFIFAMKQCAGNYIALCEGDDFWTDPLKLQKQVLFLEENEDYVIHSGVAEILRDKINSKEFVGLAEKPLDFTLENFYSQNNLITCTVMFRNATFQFPESFIEVKFGDWFLYVILMRNSGLKAFRSIELFSVYRLHDGGVMSNLSVSNYCDAHVFQITTIHKYIGNKRLQLKELNTLNNYFLRKYRLLIKEELYFEAIKTFIANFKYCTFKMPFRKYISALKQKLLQN